MATIVPLLTRLGLDASGFETGVDDAEKSMGKFEKRLKGLDKVATGASLAAGAAFSVGFMKALDVEAGAAKLNAQLGTTGATAEKISKVAGKVFAGNFGDSMDQVNEGLKGVVQNFDGMRDASSATLQDMTQRALTLASVMGEDVNKVTAATSQILRNNLAGSAKEAFDVIQRGVELGVNKSEDLLDTFNEYSTQFRKLGIDAKMALGLMSQGLKAGARDADTVADALKEFAIRAADGSATSAAGYKALGLDAKKMTEIMAKGGPEAAKGLELVIKKFQGLGAGAKKETAQVELFGTKAEDLQKALNGMDPTTAVQALGQVDGAVDKATKTMGDTAASRVETFKRSLQTSFTDAIGNAVPILSKFMDFLSKLGISPAVIASFTLFAAALALTAMGATKAALGYQAAAGMLAKYAVGTRIQLGLLKLWTLAQAAFNAVMAANPIAIAIIAIIALIAIVVVCYKKFDWFRNLVNTVWAAIKTGAALVWSFLKMVFSGIMSGLASTGGFFKGLWSVVQMVWNGIALVIGVAWKVIQVYFKIIGWFISNILVPYFKILLFVAKLVFWGIKVSIEIMWKFIKPIWDGFMIALKLLWGVIKFIFGLIKSYFTNVVIPVFKTYWAIVKWAFDQVASKAKWLWNNGIKPAFDAIKKGVGYVKTAFSVAVSAISKIWNGLKAVVRKPVEFVINTVYRDGIKKLWDSVAKLVHLSPMPAPPKFASGGYVRGPGGPRSDSISARLSNGEFVVNANSTRRNLALLHAINDGGTPFQQAKKAQLAGDPGFAFGGIVGAVKSFAGKAKDFFAGGLMKAAKAAVGPILNAARSAIGGSEFGKMNIGLVSRGIDGMLGVFKEKEKLLGANGVVGAARSQLGLPYSWGGGGKGGPSYGIGKGAGTYGFDCSGLTEYAWWKGAHKSIGGTTNPQWANSNVTTRRPGALGFPSGPSVHVVLDSGAGRIIEAPYTGAKVRERSAPTGGYVWRWPKSAMDTGYGHLSPGWNSVYNGTGGTETIRRTTQNNEMSGGLTVIMENHGVIGSQQQLKAWFTGMYAELQRKNRVP